MDSKNEAQAVRDESIVTGALFDLMGFLTGSETKWTFSAYDSASPAVDALRQFADRRGLNLGDADVANWRARLSAQPAVQVPQDAKTGVDLIAAERARQIAVEGWTPEHDDEHTESEMALAAACYAMTAGGYAKGQIPPIWPWSLEWWKPQYGIRDLVRAGALIAAEIDRLQRIAAPGAADRKGE